MKKLFLSHFNGDAPELHQLAQELQFRGVTPWVDKLGGFQVADDSATAARRAIREQSMGFLLYATPKALTRDFIRLHEVPHALAAKEEDPSYMLFAVPRNQSFSALKKRSEKAYGHDLSRYHTHPICEVEPEELRDKFALVASDVAKRVVAYAPELESGQLGIQFSTIESVPAHEPHFVDGRAVYADGADPRLFDRLISGMRDLKREISNRYGRPRLRVEGSKHLSAAFAFGRVFQPFELDIRQVGEQYWSSDTPYEARDMLSETLEVAEGSAVLAVQISSREKILTHAVDEKLRPAGTFTRLTLRPESPLDVDGELCCALAAQAYRAIEKAVIECRPSEIHIFAAAPQSLMMMIGKRFAGMPKTFAYDYREPVYGPARSVPAGHL